MQLQVGDGRMCKKRAACACEIRSACLGSREMGSLKDMLSIASGTREHTPTETIGLKNLDWDPQPGVGLPGPNCSAANLDRVPCENQSIGGFSLGVKEGTSGTKVRTM